MQAITTIGLDIAKSVFGVHGAVVRLVAASTQGGPNDGHLEIAEWTRYGALDGAAP
jgi:hypothetical protein